MSVHQDQFRAFAVYNREFNKQVLGVAAELTDNDRKRDRGAFFGSIHGTLNHILLGDRLWLARFQDNVAHFAALEGVELLYEVSGLTQELYASFDELCEQRRRTDLAIEAWTEELTDSRLSGTMRYANTQGMVREHPVWLAVAHLFNHQTHHRGQITTLLSQAGKNPGTTDFLAFGYAWVSSG